MRYLMAAFLLIPLSVKTEPGECRIVLSYPPNDPASVVVIVQPRCSVEGADLAMTIASKKVEALRKSLR